MKRTYLITICIARVNARAVSRAQYLRKWLVLPGDFTLEGGELTPTMKLKRSAVYTKYLPSIETMYADASDAPLVPSRL